ncbi:MAG TPA: alpha/beta hydrolase [Terriglobales bacterium]|nr:alpha/beta hydrolase [Terriglobales bacterium]
MILLHGAGGNSHWFAGLAAHLPAQELVLVDLPGHGGSDDADSWSLEDIAVGVVDATADLSASPMVWVGHSWGGKIAALIAAMQPARVAGLILIDPSPAQASDLRGEQLLAEGFARELDEWRSVADAIAAARRLPQYATWDDMLADAFRAGLVEEASGRCRSRLGRAAFVDICEAIFSNDCTARFQAIGCPTLVLVASQSAAWQAATNRIAFTEAQWQVLSGTHWLYLDQPTAVSAAIDAWLAANGFQ